MTLLPTTTTTIKPTSTNTNNDTIYNYDYISHAANGRQRSYEEIKVLESFYLLFDPPATTPPATPMATPPKEAHLSSVRQTDTLVVESSRVHLSSYSNPTSKIKALAVAATLPSHSRRVTLIVEPNTKFTTTEPTTLFPTQTNTPAAKSRGLFYFDLAEPPPTNGMRQINHSQTTANVKKTPLTRPSIEMWIVDETGHDKENPKFKVKATGALFYFDLEEPPPMMALDLAA